MERLGMRREIHTVRESLHRSGEWLDGLGYALLADEWPGGVCSRGRTRPDLLARGRAQTVGGAPPLDDKHRGLVVEVGVYDLGDVGVEQVAAGPRARPAWTARPEIFASPGH